MNAQERDVFLLALVAYAEARSEQQAGIRAQIWSVLNRHDAGKWYSGKTIGETLFKPYAYSALNTTDPNRGKAVSVDWNDPVWQLCRTEAESALAGLTADPTSDATHYFVAGSPEPDWVSGVRDGKQVAPAATFCCQIGRHKFYKGVK